ncbi:biotin--protein ligase-like [Ylistrum balloti]|uniref:biotin--protein ligase-like n=1 Tax=Ylistrum balloti TaxID=509963 RepID=UPI002905E52B|nr:biotin--protein ligase-like [Ylistrum balloti]XP_060063920.1 biotin--protein ligase-like [Ylistrum balloti]
MILSLGYAGLYLVQWLVQWTRRNMFRRAISKVIGSQGLSLVVQRSPQGLEDLLKSLNICTSTLETQCLLNPNRKAVISSLMPQVEVNLSDWTSYYAMQKHYHTEGGEENINVLLEAVRPTDRSNFLQREFSVPEPQKIHVASHGTALAWRTGPPFGILMRCSLEELVTLCFAFCEGALTLDEELLVQRIVSVKTCGSAADLVPQIEECQAGEDTVTEETDLHQELNINNIQSVLLKAQRDRLGETVSCDWSNESLASRTSICSSNLLDSTTPTPYSESVVEDEAESGCGEELCEFDSQFLESVERVKMMSGNIKPPNILVYCGKKDTDKKFAAVKATLEQCINLERYVIYALNHDQVKRDPWADNSALLVVSCDSLHDGVGDAFLRYFESGGIILSFGSPFDAMFVARHEIEHQDHMGISKVNFLTWKEVSVLCGNHWYDPKEVTGEKVTLTVLGTNHNGRPVILDVKSQAEEAGHAIMSQVLLNRDPTEHSSSAEQFTLLKQSNQDRCDMLKELLQDLGVDTDTSSVPVFTPCYLLSNNESVKSKFLESVQTKLNADGKLLSSTVTLQFMSEYSQSEGPVTESLLPVVTGHSTGQGVLNFFNDDVYFKNLSSTTLGNTLMVIDVLPTTMPLFDKLQFCVPSGAGVIAIPGKQTRGKGRGGNAWLSPVGCAMFSLLVSVPMDSPLGRHASYLQHITSLAVVESVRSLPGYQDIDLRLKWPNDIYFSNKMKLGGVVIKSTITDGVLQANIGCGFNVSNKNPTICINDLIERHNNETGNTLDLCSKEQLVGRTVSIIEHLINQFQTEGESKFLQLYCQRWLHSGSRVHLEEENIDVTIQGLDEYGYLDVIADDGTRHSVQPDGNSFDMMRNLISMKTR